jgi:twitching motility protein PilI
MDITSRDPATQSTEVALTEIGARRTRLREFQASLVERMRAAQLGTQVRASQLGILVGQARYLLDLREAGEIVSAGTMAAVPLTKDWYLGLSNIRGSLTSVIDLGRFEGRDRTRVDNNCRIIAFSPSLSFNSGLLVSQVLGLRSSAEMEEIAVENPADAVTKPWLIRTFRDQDSNIWTELSLATLLQDQNFLHVGL